MAIFSLAVSCSLLEVDPKTLRRWLRLAHCSPRPDPLDARKRCLTLPQLQQLARLHARPLPCAPPIPSAPSSSSPPSAFSSTPPPAPPPDAPLQATLATLQDRVSLLGEQVAHLTSALIRERDLRLQHLVGVTPPLRPTPDAAPCSVPFQEPPVASALSSDVPAPSPVPLKPLPRHPHPPVIPLIEAREDGTVVLICPQRGILSLLPDTPEWFAWLASLPSFRFQGPAETLWRSAQNHRWSPHPRMARLLPLQKPPALLLSRHDRTRDHRSPGADGCHDHRSARHPLSCSAFEDASPPHAFSQVPL